jgi:pantoate--beta-alanine ligase
LEVLRSIAEFRRARDALRGSLGFVPTMGFLHEGHMSLVRAARESNDHAAASIFVNPTQFGPNEDFSRYPRDEGRDLAMLRGAGVDLVFMPEAAEMYPEGATTFVDPGPIAEVLEGKFRPGHFRGVATIVLKLFEAVHPTRAYFGRKDAQQLAVLKKLVRDLDLGLAVEAVDTVRAPDGLALSSRNAYLTPADRERGLGLPRGLERARRLWEKGERDPGRLVDGARDPGLDYDYLAAVDPDSFGPPLPRGPLLLVAAARVGSTRLLDNALLPVPPTMAG